MRVPIKYPSSNISIISFVLARLMAEIVMVIVIESTLIFKCSRWVNKIYGPSGLESR
jgi:hypothetical protein